MHDVGGPIDSPVELFTAPGRIIANASKRTEDS